MRGRAQIVASMAGWFLGAFAMLLPDQPLVLLPQMWTSCQGLL